MLTELSFEETHKLVETYLKEYYRLDDGEISLFFGILKHPGTLSNLAIKVGLDRTKCYKAGNKLADLGLIESVSGNPKVYHAKEPNEALHIFIDMKINELKKLQDKATIVENYLNHNLSELKTTTALFTILQGDYSISSQINGKIKRNESEIKILMDFADLKTYYHTELPEIISKHAFPTKIITNPQTGAEQQFLKNFGKCTLKTIHDKSIPLMVLLKDFCFMGISEGYWRHISNYRRVSDDNATCFVTNSPGLKQIANTNFEYLWNRVEEIERY